MRIVKKQIVEDKENYWDITIPKNHNFVLDNGCVVHNCGCGVGFSVERQFIANLPVINEDFYPVETVIQVHDSRIGWSTAFRQLIALLYAGQIPHWDLTKLRPKGSRLKTFGGRASGPEPLNQLFKFCVEIFKRAAGRKLNSIECHDIVCKIADIVIVGGVRRSALISLSNLSDDRMRTAKTGQWWVGSPQRALANNSSAYTEKPEIEIFLKEWLTLIESKSGERGIFNRVSATKKAASTGRRKTEGIAFGTNPCLTGDTLVAVADGRGHVTLEQLAQEGNDVPVYCFNEAGKIVISNMINPGITGYNLDVYEVTVDGGHTFKATSNHKMLVNGKGYVEIGDLKEGDSLRIITKYQSLNGSNPYWVFCNNSEESSEHRLIGEHFHGTGKIIHHKNHDSLDNRPENLKPMSLTDHNYEHEFYKSAGEDNGRYIDVSNDSLREYAKTLCLQLGKPFSASEWAAYAKENGLPQSFSNFRRRELGDLRFLARWAAIQVGVIDDDKQNLDPRTIKKLNTLLQQGHDVEIIDDKFVFHKTCSQCGERFDTHSVNVMYCSVSCSNRNRPYQSLKSVGENHKVISIRLIGKETVYNGTVEKYHNFFIGGWEEPKRKGDGNRFVYLNTRNCGEIYLRSCGFCNLSEVVIRPEDDLETLTEKVRLASIIGTFQSTLTDFRYIRNIWKKNAEEERLLGVSLTGIMDHPILSQVTKDAEMWLTLLRATAINTNKEWAEKLGIEQSAAVTCVKPSGCQSLDNKIKTSDGDKSVREIFEMVGWTEEMMEGMERVWLDADLSSLPQVLDENNRLQDITGLFVNGLEPVYEIEFEDGNTYQFTGNHKLKTDKGWKRVDELTEEAEVLDYE